MIDQNQQNLLKVLIVDDNATARSGLKALLDTASADGGGLKIFEAANGQEALQLTKIIQPDVVLMDIQMPGLNGIEATHIIKQRWPAIKVVILTMYTIHQDEARGAGADRFLLKGCSPDVLFTAIYQ